jgi:hypothetical protein
MFGEDLLERAQPLGKYFVIEAHHPDTRRLCALVRHLSGTIIRPIIGTIKT